MQDFRIVNFVMQSAYLVLHLIFIIRLYHERGSTPVWKWFFYISVALWFWVSGRFMETIIYLFFPANNAAYVFAANYQYIGNMTATIAYLIWVLYLGQQDRIASSKWFRIFVWFTCPIPVCVLVFTNDYHHLFYTKLVMNERVDHGPLFYPLMIWSFLLLLAGYMVSILFVIKSGRDRVKRLLLFSIFPLLPAFAILLRSLTGIDRLDYTPLVMSVSMFSLYQIIFKYRYVNIVSASIKEVLEQASHPIVIFNPATGVLEYINRIAGERYTKTIYRICTHWSGTACHFEDNYTDRHLIIDIKPLSKGDLILITAADITDITHQQAILEAQIKELELHRLELEEANRNIDAYLGSLRDTERLVRKQDMIAKTYEIIAKVLADVEANFSIAQLLPSQATIVLEDNLRLTRECIAVIRRTVNQLREGKI